MATRNKKASQNLANQIHKDGLPSKGVKRQPQDRSPQVPAAKKTRTAFGDITNKENAKVVDKSKKGTQRKPVKAALKKKKTTTVLVPKQQQAVDKKGQTSGALSPTRQEENESWEVIELSQGSLSSSQGPSSSQSSPKSEVSAQNEKNSQLSQKSPKRDWIDIDAENKNDPLHCPSYAFHIFEYYKSREDRFRVADYLSTQKDLSSSMRAILVDWLVEVQENFELNHETLYLAVKLVDQYLSRVHTSKDRLQLVGATSMFIASKFDERLPPVLDDFLYICDDAYSRDELLSMERKILRAIDFDLGIPLSYRYLRRYAKCARVCMVTLTLGRYILELSLMDYHFSRMSDSKLAAAALLLAMRMKSSGSWDRTLEHYTGRAESELTETLRELNRMVGGESSKQLTTIRTKYSHKVFHEVAKIPTIDPLEL